MRPGTGQVCPVYTALETRSGGGWRDWSVSNLSGQRDKLLYF